jgi:Zn finger protein HypA/HybF involved in hydrogenase expression
MHRLIQIMAAVYTLVCPKCRQILQFDRPGMQKCPKCNIPMMQK